jgi:hypothetical protein
MAGIAAATIIAITVNNINTRLISTILSLEVEEERC